MRVVKRLGLAASIFVVAIGLGFGAGFAMPGLQVSTHQPLSVGASVPDRVEISDENERSVNLTDLLDESRNTVLFIASDGCAPCQGKLVGVWEAVERHESTHAFLPVAVGSDFARQLSRITGGELRIRVLKEMDRLALGALVSPTVYVLNPKGTVVYAALGTYSARDIQRHLISATE